LDANSGKQDHLSVAWWEQRSIGTRRLRGSRLVSDLLNGESCARSSALRQENAHINVVTADDMSNEFGVLLE
jgi:hypothetical protein